MVIGDFEVPELEPSEETSTSAIIRNECILKTFDVKGKTFFIIEYSHRVSYSEFFTKTFEGFYLVVGSVGKLMFIDIVVGLTRDEEKYIILITSTESILNRAIKSIDKDGNGDISHLIHLPEEGIIKRNTRFLKDKRYHHFSIIVETLLKILFYLFIASECPVEDEIQIIVKAVLEDFIRDSYGGFLVFACIFTIVSAKHLAIRIDIDDDEVRFEIRENRLQEFTFARARRSREKYG